MFCSCEYWRLAKTALLQAFGCTSQVCIRKQRYLISFFKTLHFLALDENLALTNVVVIILRWCSKPSDVEEKDIKMCAVAILLQCWLKALSILFCYTKKHIYKVNRHSEILPTWSDKNCHFNRFWMYWNLVKTRSYGWRTKVFFKDYPYSLLIW